MLASIPQHSHGFFHFSAYLMFYYFGYIFKMLWSQTVSKATMVQEDILIIKCTRTYPGSLTWVQARSDKIKWNKTILETDAQIWAFDYFSRESHNLIPEVCFLQTFIYTRIVKKGWLRENSFCPSGYCQRRAGKRKSLMQHTIVSHCENSSHNKAQRHLPVDWQFLTVLFTKLPK